MTVVVICVIDEAAPEVNGTMMYLVVGAVMLADEATARAAMLGVTAGRKRLFHWADEGIEKRSAMAAAAAQVGALAHGFEQACGRRGQEHARKAVLDPALTWAVANGALHIIIESRSQRQDTRDKATVKATMRRLGVPPNVPRVDWRPKSEPLLWLADATAGVLRERYVPSKNDGPSRQLETATNLAVIYVPQKK